MAWPRWRTRPRPLPSAPLAPLPLSLLGRPSVRFGNGPSKRVLEWPLSDPQCFSFESVACDDDYERTARRRRRRRRRPRCVMNEEASERTRRNATQRLVVARFVLRRLTADVFSSGKNELARKIGSVSYLLKNFSRVIISVLRLALRGNW